MSDPNDVEAGVGSTTLDYLKIRYAWLGELIDEANAELEHLRALEAWHTKREPYLIAAVAENQGFDGDISHRALYEWMHSNPKPVRSKRV